MFDKLRKTISRIDADYADLRYEVKKETTVRFDGKRLTQFGSNSTDGHVLRIMDKGGVSSITYTNEKDVEKAIHGAVEYSRLLGKGIETPVKLAEVEAVKDTYVPELKEDPRKVSIDEKLELTRNYNNIPLKHKEIVTTITVYREIIREKYFVSTEGTEIREDLITTRIIAQITSKAGNIMQNVYAGNIGSSGFSVIRNLEKDFEEKTAIAISLLKANSVNGGVYNCILNPQIASTFVHEAFGHLSEADIINTLPAMRKKMNVGEKLGNETLNIKDDATLPDQLGHYKYDDEGVRVRPVQLMQNGILTGRLHSRRTAFELNEPITGHYVAEDYRFAPIVRMGNIFIEPGKQNTEQLLNTLGDGLYLLDTGGGHTGGENFTFASQYGFMVKNGKKKEMIRDANISGDLFKTLKNITTVGRDLTFTKMGGCGKMNQDNIRSCSGAPHIIIRNLVVGGR